MRNLEMLEKYKNEEITGLDLFCQDHNIKIITIKVSCTSCGHSWGIKIDEYNSTSEIPKRKFKCSECEM